MAQSEFDKLQGQLVFIQDTFVGYVTSVVVKEVVQDTGENDSQSVAVKIATPLQTLPQVAQVTFQPAHVVEVSLVAHEKKKEKRSLLCPDKRIVLPGGKRYENSG